LLYKENDDSHIKLIDFGLAKKVSKNELMTTPNGTPYYIAPEVLKGSYTTQCDNWSMGVVMYIMLSGRPPFGGKNNNEILHNVLHGTFDFSASVWASISDDAKDLIKNLIERQADVRFTSEEAFNHAWISKQRHKEEKDMVVPLDVIKNMSSYIDSQNFKRTTLTLIASRIPEDQIKALRETFSQFDKNGDG
jgi:calcium-dependent protein kinase